MNARSTSRSSAAASSGWPLRASCCGGARARRVVVLEREHDVGRHQTGRNSGVAARRHLLRAGVAQGAAVRRGRARAVRVLRARTASPHEQTGKLIVATERRRAARARRARAPRRRQRRTGAAPPAARTSSRSSSRTRPASRRCTRLLRASSTFARRRPRARGRGAGGGRPDRHRRGDRLRRAAPARAGAARRATRRARRARGLLRRATWSDGWRSRRAPTATRGSSRSAARGCGSSRSAATWCGR